MPEASSPSRHEEPVPLSTAGVPPPGRWAEVRTVLREGKALKEALGERLISLRTMPPIVRAAAITAIGLLVAAMVLALLKKAHLPDAKLSIAGANPIVMPLPALVLILLSFGLAWCYGIVGALYGPVLIRVALLALFAIAMLDQGSALWTDVTAGRGPALLAALGLLGAAVVAHGWSTRGRGRAPLSSRREVLLTAGVFALVALVQVTGWWASRGAPLPGSFAISLVFELSLFAVLAQVFLSSSGADFAQVAHVAGSVTAAMAGALRVRRLFAIVGLAVAGALLVRAVSRLSGHLPAQLGLAVLGGGVIAVVARRNRQTMSNAGRLPSWVSIVAGILMSAVLIVAVLIGSWSSSAKPHVSFALPAPTNVYTQPSAPQFSIALPPGWTVTSAGGRFSFSGLRTGVPALAEVFAIPLPRPLSRQPTAPQWRQALESFVLRGFPQARFSPTAYPNRLAMVLATPAGGQLQGLIMGAVTAKDEWLVQVLANGAVWPEFTNSAAAIISSWRPDRGAQPVVQGEPSSGSATGSTGNFGLIGFGLAALLAGLMLFVRLPRTLMLTGMLLMASMLLAGLVNLNFVVAVVVGHTVSGVPHLSLTGIEAAVAIAIVLLAVPTLGPRPPAWARSTGKALVPLVILAVTLYLLGVLLDLYSNAAGSGTLLSAGGVTILIGAFLWDVVLSGDLTNRDGRRARRPGRVLMYMGYTLAASSAVLYFGFAHEIGPWAVHDYFFAPEEQTALSLGVVGIPYAVILFVGLLFADAALEPSVGAEPIPDSEPIPDPELIADEVANAVEEI